jgi:hypothetical protein
MAERLVASQEGLNFMELINSPRRLFMETNKSVSCIIIQFIGNCMVGKPEGKRPLGRPRRRWVDDIRMNLGEVGWGDVDWIGLAKDRNRWRALVNSVLNLRVP